ncbi:putative frv operon regulatory protein [Enterobacter bugandensis]|uniref:putative frv operon regulatory protein n=1 Tax=Enterobacter bugandensis TaxID=881260 RepID=UPI002074B319|nr:putative frv operon regulatory protein [Enterobacter bugandensis]MCM7471137.1 putative frv operon regulatory protein [Enterobacter bugandensis]
MLNERQFALLDALESQPAALSGLAQHTGVSARTILRDIDYINFTLSGTARIRATGSALYRLDITDRKQYFRLLQRHDNDDRLLALLLIHPVMSRAQLADALNLPDAWIAERLPRLRQRYARAFLLASRPGAGYFIDVDPDKRLILLANLFKKDPLVFPLAGIAPATLPMLHTHCQRLTAWPDIQTDYRVSVVLAGYALRQQLPVSAGAAGSDALRDCCERTEIWLSPTVINVIASTLSRLQQRASGITSEYVAERLARLSTVGQPQIIDDQLKDDLTAHLKRCVAMPNWLPESRPGSMNNLKAAWPAAFDLSVKFINQLRTEIDIPLIDSDLPGLYFACALERHHSEWTPIVLLADQNAIATINKMAIEREVMNCRVVVAFTPDELAALTEECQPALIVNNSHFLLNDSLRNVLAIRNIITAAGIDQIKDFLASAFIRQQPERFFPPEGAFHYANSASESWEEIIAAITARLLEKQLITRDEALRISQREREGENLIVNHVAIPHCWSEAAGPFRGFFITLERALHVNGQPVKHAIIACASAVNRQELKVFSFLAGMLSSYSPQQIDRVDGYETFIALLR